MQTTTEPTTIAQAPTHRATYKHTASSPHVDETREVIHECWQRATALYSNMPKVTEVIFSQFNRETGRMFEVRVPWEKAYAYWIAHTTHDIKVRFEGYDVDSFAKWQATTKGGKFDPLSPYASWTIWVGASAGYGLHYEDVTIS